MELTTQEICLITMLAGVVSLAVIVLWARLSPDPDQAIRQSMRAAEAQTVFLFDNGDLVDCTVPARRIMDEISSGGTDLQRLLRGLAPRFPSLEAIDTLQTDGDEREYRTDDPSDGLKLRFESWNGFLRATLSQDTPELADYAEEDPAARGVSNELQALRTMTDEAPFLLWQTDPSGEITWANEPYLERVAKENPENKYIWPPHKLFPEVHADPPVSGAAHRCEHVAGDDIKIFDIHCARKGEKQYFAAVSADAIVKAEDTQREFVQTLTKTFAHLSIGLAIFDRGRSLTLFNPALLDLMRLPVDFLSQKPTLHGFLDRLREEKLIPEPKDYKAWRQQLLDLESQAAEGSYCETWSLPGGLTFRVTGRPHPDGAIAFLFEDISAEMALTRRFNAEIELSRAALDAVDEALVVVNAAGIVALSNAAYRALWQADPDAGVVVSRLREVSRTWRDIAGDGDIWTDILAAAERRDAKKRWSGEMRMTDGRLLQCRTERLSGGATLIGFAVDGAQSPRKRGVAAS